MHSLQYAFRDRRARKGDFRKLWIQRINAACRQNGMSYSRFIAGLRWPASKSTARSSPTSPSPTRPRSPPWSPRSRPDAAASAVCPVPDRHSRGTPAERMVIERRLSARNPKRPTAAAARRGIAATGGTSGPSCSRAAPRRRRARPRASRSRRSSSKPRAMAASMLDAALGAGVAGPRGRAGDARQGRDTVTPQPRRGDRAVPIDG